MHPIAVLYYLAKKRESGRFQFVPADGKNYGVVKLELVDGNLVGFDTTWGAAVENLGRMLKWEKALVKTFDITSSTNIVRIFVPRDELLARIVRFDVERMLPNLRDPSPEELVALLKTRIGKRMSATSDLIRKVEEGVEMGSFVLQSDRGYLSVILTGKRVCTLKLNDGVRRISPEDFPYEDAQIIKMDHLFAVSGSTPLFTESRIVPKEDILPTVKRLKSSPSSIWHMILEVGHRVYVSVLGYRGVFLGVILSEGDDVKVYDESALKVILEKFEVKGRLSEYA